LAKKSGRRNVRNGKNDGTLVCLSSVPRKDLLRKTDTFIQHCINESFSRDLIAGEDHALDVKVAKQSLVMMASEHPAESVPNN
jgi:hypothetical protein